MAASPGHKTNGEASLPQDLLGLVFTKLDMQELLSTVPLVCKRWRATAVSCPDLWASLELVIGLDQPGVERLSGFSRWLVPRAQHVRSLRFCTLGMGVPEVEEPHQQQAWALFQSVLHHVAPWLRQLDLEWAGSIIDTAWMLPLPALASLELDALSIKLDARIAEQSQLTRLKMAGQLSLPDAEGALPPGLKVLSISHSDPLQLPACLPRLTALQRLNLSECTFGGGEGEAEAPDWAAPLVAATSLEHLAMHYCTMARLPPALSGLTNLRALLLDYNDHQQLDEDLEEMLAPLKQLQILGLSNCRLRALPACVSGLTKLRCLYAEDNRISALPEGPYLRGLQILSADWRVLLGCGARLLPAACELRQLYVCRPFPYLPAASDRTRQEALAAVVVALRAHPVLATCTFVMYENERLSQQVEVANFMLVLSRECPRLHFSAIRSDNFFAVSMETLDAALARGAVAR